MPEVYKFHCNHCELSFPTGWDGYTYVINSNGLKITCPHPGEITIIHNVLGKNITEEVIRKMTGFNSHCICLGCLNQFDIDVNKQKRKCPSCGSHRIKTVLELVGGICPKCKAGRIAKENTGIIS